ncbi:unnamed protein product [marine sediment metagenome]|uniref:Uncharacterized protein n=1 Tax=marine sediment metagenome TaxID=412755 RepID=X0U8Y6_9ZZZZ
MIYSELKQKLRDYTHRGDLDPYLFGFVDAAKERINTRFGLELGALQIDSDTNTVLGNQPNLYFYASMREASIYIKDFQEGQVFDALFDKEARNMNIHYNGDDWVNNNTELTWIRSEEESAAILEAAE